MLKPTGNLSRNGCSTELLESQILHEIGSLSTDHILATSLGLQPVLSAFRELGREMVAGVQRIWPFNSRPWKSSSTQSRGSQATDPFSEGRPLEEHPSGGATGFRRRKQIMLSSDCMDVSTAVTDWT